MIEFAAFWNRIGARLLDSIIVGVPVVFLISFTFGFSYVTEPGVNFYFNISMLILSLAYAIVIPVKWSGYTIGKKICNVRILHIDGTEVTYKTMLKRETFIMAAYTLSFGILFLMSLVMMITRADKRAFHDLVAKTEVLHE